MVYGRVGKINKFATTTINDIEPKLYNKIGRPKSVAEIVVKIVLPMIPGFFSP